MEHRAANSREDAPESGALSGRSGALPKYLQLSELLTREVLAGRLKDGARLPPEREMAVEFGVSVGTLRKALAALEESDLLERIQGSGNYIRSRVPVRSVYGMFRLERPEGGGLPTARVLRLDHLPPPKGLADHMPAGAKAWRVRRIRSLDDRPVAAEEIWFHAQDPQVLTPDDLSESMYLFYRQTLGRWIGQAEDAVGVGQMPTWAVGLTPGAAGHIARIARAQDGQVMEVSETWFDPDHARYVARLDG